MKRRNFMTALCALFALTLCVMTSCTKDEVSKNGRIQGIVSNMNTNEPIQGVNITLSPTGLSAVTGSDGRYEFSDLEPGLYTVQGVKTGFESNTKSIDVTGNGVTSGDMMMRPAVAGFTLNVEYLDFGNAFSELSFKIINKSETLPVSWEIDESMNWMTVTPNTGNLQGGQETTVYVKIDRSLITHDVNANITVRCPEMTVVLPVSVRK